MIVLWPFGMCRVKKSLAVNLVGAHFMWAYSRANAWSYWGLFGVEQIDQLDPVLLRPPRGPQRLGKPGQP